MDAGRITEDEILKSIETLSDEFQISSGQAQKPINEMLKFHFFAQQSVYWRNWLCAFSCAIVVAGPWPGYTLVSSGRVKRFSLMLFIS